MKRLLHRDIRWLECPTLRMQALIVLVILPTTTSDLQRRSIHSLSGTILACSVPPLGLRLDQGASESVVRFRRTGCRTNPQLYQVDVHITHSQIQAYMKEMIETRRTAQQKPEGADLFRYIWIYFPHIDSLANQRFDRCC